MTRHIQQRIRNLIWQHAWALSDMGCICGFECFPHEHAPHVAEMITTELVLTPEFRHGVRIEPKNPYGITRDKRWVTKWENDNE